MRRVPPLWRQPSWVLLATGWLTLPVTAGAALPSLLRSSGATAGGRAAAWTLAGLAYGAGVVALLRPGSAALTALRVLAAGMLAWVGVPALLTLPAAPGGALLALGFLLTLLAWSPPVAQVCADAGAVPGERRFALAAPPGLSFGLGPLAAATACSGVVAPVLLGSGVFLRARVLPAVLTALAGAGAVLLFGSAVSRLSRRWLVLVPSGIVLHDPVLLYDTYRLSPDEVGGVALTAPGWRSRLRAPDVLDATGGVRRAMWIGLVSPLSAPGTRPGVRRPPGPVRHVFCAPLLRGEAAAALAGKGYRLTDPVGPP